LGDFPGVGEAFFFFFGLGVSSVSVFFLAGDFLGVASGVSSLSLFFFAFDLLAVASGVSLGVADELVRFFFFGVGVGVGDFLCLGLGVGV
jgi:hypothetical protein